MAVLIWAVTIYSMHLLLNHSAMSILRVLAAITLYCTWSDNRKFQGKLVFRTFDKFTGRARPILTTGNPDNQRPDKWSSTVVFNNGLSCRGKGMLAEIMNPRGQNFYFGFTILWEKLRPLSYTQLTQNLKESVFDVGRCDCVTGGKFATVERGNKVNIRYRILDMNVDLVWGLNITTNRKKCYFSWCLLQQKLKNCWGIWAVAVHTTLPSIEQGSGN